MKYMIQFIQEGIGVKKLKEKVLNKLKSDETKEIISFLLFATIKFLQFFFLASILFITSSLIYSLIYFLVIPSRLYEQPIYFNYGKHYDLPLIYHSESSIHSKFILPTANLNLLTNHIQWKSSNYTDSGEFATSILTPGLIYDIYIELHLPETNVNEEIGMFMVKTTLFSRKKINKNNKNQLQRLASSSRPLMLPHSHWLINIGRLLFWNIPLILGFVDMSKKLSVKAMNAYYENKEYPITNVKIQLSHPKIQIYSATLYIVVQLTGIRYLMYNWFIPVSILAIINIAMGEAFLLFILYTYYKISKENKDHDVKNMEKLNHKIKTIQLHND